MAYVSIIASLSSNGCYASNRSYTGYGTEGHLGATIRPDTRLRALTVAYFAIDKTRDEDVVLHEIASALDRVVGSEIGVMRTPEFWITLVREVFYRLRLMRPVDVARYTIGRIDGLLSC